MHSTGEMLIKRFVFSYSFQIGFGLVSNQKACILFFHCNFSYHTETNIVTPKLFLGEKFQRDYLFITVTICRNLKKVIPSWQWNLFKQQQHWKALFHKHFYKTKKVDSFNTNGIKTINLIWWTWGDSNSRPPQCECGALPDPAYHGPFCAGICTHRRLIPTLDIRVFRHCQANTGTQMPGSSEALCHRQCCACQ